MTSVSLIPVESVLVVVRGMILAHSFPVAIAEAPVTLNQDMKALLALRDLNPEFLLWSLTGLREPILALVDESAHGTKKLETELLIHFPIPLPPMTEQVAISSHLKTAMSELDALVDQVQNGVERLQEYRTALITAAVTGKIDVRESAQVAREEVVAG